MITETVKLIMADLESNSHKFWTGFLHDDGSITSENGRIGITKVSNTTRYNGKRAFDKLVASKRKKGYVDLKTIDSSAAKIIDVGSSDLAQIAKTQIKTTSPELQKLIDRFVAANVHKITSSTNLQYNSSSGLFSTPLGIVDLQTINDSRDILAKIKNKMENSECKSKEFLSLVNKYLTNIPENLGMKLSVERVFPKGVVSIQEKNDILDALESSYNTAIIPSKADGSTKIAQIEQVFDTELDVCNDSAEIDRISKWFYSSNHKIHGYSHVKIKNFYKTVIKPNWHGFNEKLGNIKEMVHSTSESNLLSILKSGLKPIAPSTAFICGNLFGPGIYCTTEFSKSLQYTFGRFGGPKGESGWSLVCDFAMGNEFKIKTYGGNRPKGYDSTYAYRNLTGLKFDEAVVPNSNQCKIKYILELV